MSTIEHDHRETTWIGILSLIFLTTLLSVVTNRVKPYNLTQLYKFSNNNAEGGREKGILEHIYEREATNTNWLRMAL